MDRWLVASLIVPPCSNCHRCPTLDSDCDYVQTSTPQHLTCPTPCTHTMYPPKCRTVGAHPVESTHTFTRQCSSGHQGPARPSQHSASLHLDARPAYPSADLPDHTCLSPDLPPVCLPLQSRGSTCIQKHLSSLIEAVDTELVALDIQRPGAQRLFAVELANALAGAKVHLRSLVADESSEVSRCQSGYKSWWTGPGQVQCILLELVRSLAADESHLGWVTFSLKGTRTDGLLRGKFSIP